MRVGRWSLLLAVLLITVEGLPSQRSAAAASAVPAGAPVIFSASPAVARIEGGELVTVMGVNFTSGMTVTLGDAVVDDLTVLDSGHLTFRVPRQKAPGRRTLTIRNVAGFDQAPFRIAPTPLEELPPCGITTVAGGLRDAGDRSGRDSGRIVISPYRLAIDPQRNVFVADRANHRIRRIDGSGGRVWTVAGCGRKGSDSDGVPAVIAALDAPQGVAVDGAGNLFFTDTGNNRVRRVDFVTGALTTVAGTGAAGFGGDGGPGVEAVLNAPDDVATDSAGNVYFSDALNYRVRRVDAATGVITTVAGGDACGEGNGDGGPATEACLYPSGIDIDATGNLFVCDQLRSQVRRVDRATGLISTVAGSGAGGIGDYVDGPALEIVLDAPFDVDVAADGSIYVTDGRPTDFDYIGEGYIRRIDPVTSWMSIVFYQQGYVSGIALDDASNLYLVDTESSAVRVISASSGLLSDYVANESYRSYAPGYGAPATECSFASIQDVDVDPQGNLFVLEGGFFTTYMVNRVDGVTGATARVRFVPDGEYSSDGIALSAGSNGRVYVGEAHFFQPGDVRRATFDALGSKVVVGGGSRPAEPGRKGSKVVIGGVYDVAINRDGMLAIAAATETLLTYDTRTGRIADVSPLFALHVAFDESNRLYLSGGRTVDRVRHGQAIRIAGTGVDSFSGDGGPATAAGFEFIAGIGFDRDGNLFILTGNRVRRVDRATGIVTTIAGAAESGYTGDGGPAADARLDEPSSLAVDASGNIYIGSYDGTVRAIRSGRAP
ncbi:MAG TPA: IPT/TIG domain-containing protein [Blastocatellia bacterium]|nr:IPT/TIG domain-containing protein [Blastocatellia bacterium]